MGYFFDVITNGFGTMPDYAAQVLVTDRWAIVGYIRALQLSQRATLADLIGRRDGLASQLDGAAVMLQTIRLDLIALRNAGVQSSIDDVSSATQEARALSREIGHVLDAAKQVRE